ncbi:universal stress protein [Natrialba swarupiae]|uniref:Universal stress protein n=1 Tax=Natrialba swarupiae TaxID=2448032 RepID=A0A5D5AHU5_9EURY|nr:universal stress protein [Natrialba swarupiae]TYT61369.1 universal stress protein [Natrialba swarupiae]
MSDRILVGYDGTPLADAALGFAFENFPDADVTAVYVIQVPEGQLGVFDGPSVDLPVSDRALEHAEDVLDGATAVAAEYDRSVDTDVVSGKPDQRLVEYADDHASDTIVVGSHGRQGVSRLLLGSVAENVVRRSPIPVVVVR